MTSDLTVDRVGAHRCIPLSKIGGGRAILSSPVLYTATLVPADSNHKDVFVPRVIYNLSFTCFLLAGAAIAQAVEPIPYGEQLKEAYPFSSTGKFYHTGEAADVFDITCDMGQAMPSTERENWYVNRPIAGLRLELKARAALRHYDGTVKAMGHVAVIKNGDPLKVFDPIGEWTSGEWDGDLLSSWPIDKPEVRLFSQRYGAKGYAHFNLMDGMGFYYNYRDQEEPAYFLSDCRRTKKSGMPVYDWDFSEAFDSSGD